MSTNNSNIAGSNVSNQGAPQMSNNTNGNISYQGAPQMNNNTIGNNVNSQGLPQTFVPPSSAEKGYDKNPNSTKAYPIICTVCGVAFIIGIYVYIFMSRNKKYSSSSRKSRRNNSSNNNSNFSSSYVGHSAGSHRINMDSNSHQHSSHNKSTTYVNFSETFNSKDEHKDASSPFSDTNNLIDGKAHMNFMNKDYGDPPATQQKKQHYPNPLFNHSKPVQQSPTFGSAATPTVAPTIAPAIAPAITPAKTPVKAPIIAPPIAPPNAMSKSTGINTPLEKFIDMDNDNDIPKNLNILTQEEIQLLKMRKNNLQPFMDDDDDDMMGYSSLKRNKKLMQTAGISTGNGMSNNGNFSTPDMNTVAPFNYLGDNGKGQTQIKKPDNVFTRESMVDDSFYNDSFINNLGDNIKIETKKIEYEDENFDSPINKLKIKRFNN